MEAEPRSPAKVPVTISDTSMVMNGPLLRKFQRPEQERVPREKVLFQSAEGS